MEETLLMIVTVAAQAGDDVLIAPPLPADKYYFAEIEKIKIVTPDNQVIEKDAEFAIPFDSESCEYLLLIPNTKKDEIPMGSQIWIKKPLEQITRKPDPTEK